ncbi:MAG TPA: carboxypeptidase regulatory-like domain-containing protein [Cyclobacteriaceae bacterium]|nr:carboxypeptidase regulatory-like domain-containing protein [Cyclobacteriaceae bacterium]
MRFIFFILFLLCTITTFSQKQGLSGQVFWVSGNQMPGPESILSPNQGAVREVLIYELTSMKDVTQVGPFFRDIKTKIIATIQSKADGTFKIKLLPGAYSVFTREKNGLYANLFDEKNNINPVIIKSGQYAWKTITIDYEVAY